MPVQFYTGTEWRETRRRTFALGYVYNSALAAHTVLSGATATDRARDTGGTFTQWNSPTLTRLGLVPANPVSTEAGQTLTVKGSAKSTYAVEFTFTGSTFDVEVSNGWVNVWADGQQVGAPLRTVGARTVRVTLPTAAPRHITVECGWSSAPGVTSSCTLAGIRHWSGEISNPNIIRRRLFVLGDSWVEGWSYDDVTNINAPSMRHMAWLAGRYAGADVYYHGLAGTGYKQTEPTTHYGAAARVAQVVSADPHDVLIFGSSNDGKTSGGATTQASALYATLATQLPNANIMVVGRQSSSNTSNANGTDADLEAAIVGHANVIGYVSPRAEAWVTGTGNSVSPAGNGTADIYQSGSDLNHLTDAGNLYYGRKIAQQLEAWLPQT